jgi:TonB family protein
MEYITKNLVYPSEAKKNKIEGRVFVSFIVEKDGSITNVKVLRGLGSGCDEEAIRIVEKMPNWTPGSNSGKPINVKFTLPIRFSL